MRIERHLVIDTYAEYHDRFRPTVAEMEKGRRYCWERRRGGKTVPLVGVMRAGNLTDYWARVAMGDAESKELGKA